MSIKKLDLQRRWRNKTVSFRVSPEEDKQIETAVGQAIWYEQTGLYYLLLAEKKN